MDLVAKSLLNGTCFFLMQILALRLPLSATETRTLTRREINALLVCAPLAYFLVQLLGSENSIASSWAISTLVAFPALIAAIAGRRFFLWGGLCILAVAILITMTVFLFLPLFSAPHLKNPVLLVSMSCLLVSINSILIFYVQFVVEQRRKDAAKKAGETIVDREPNQHANAVAPSTTITYPSLTDQPEARPIGVRS